MPTGPQTPPPPPAKPTLEECCGRGCDPCIFTYYDIALDRWEQRIEAMGLDLAEAKAAFKDRL